MKAFLILLVLSAVGLAGVLYWRHTLQAPKPPVVAAVEPGKDGKGKERRKRRKRGARRLARNEAAPPIPSAPSASSAPSRDVSPGEAPAPVFTQPSSGSAPIAPGGAATTEVAPDDVFGSSPSPSHAPSGGARQVVDEPEPIKLRPADLKIVWQGEDLSRTETTRLDFSKDAVGHELSQDEIDTRFRAKEDAVLRCVERARPDEYTFVPGRVTVRFRIQRTGTVKGVQVEAPVILHKGGLTACIKGVVGSLRFPASDAAQVISYPFSLL